MEGHHNEVLGPNVITNHYELAECVRPMLRELLEPGYYIFLQQSPASQDLAGLSASG